MRKRVDVGELAVESFNAMFLVIINEPQPSIYMRELLGSLFVSRRPLSNEQTRLIG